MTHDRTTTYTGHLTPFSREGASCTPQTTHPHTQHAHTYTRISARSFASHEKGATRKTLSGAHTTIHTNTHTLQKKDKIRETTHILPGIAIVSPFSPYFRSNLTPRPPPLVPLSTRPPTPPAPTLRGLLRLLVLRTVIHINKGHQQRTQIKTAKRMPLVFEPLPHPPP